MDDVPAPPAGTVTFLFTDIEGSTRLWEQKPGAMREDLAHHDALLRNAIEANHGHVFKTMGDQFCAVFAGASDAIHAAVEGQFALQKDLPQVRVRIALHTGDAQAREGDYFGPTLNRVARLLEVGHGGQVLLSEATAEPLRSSLPVAHPRCARVPGLRPLGRHRLRGIAGTEAIYQLLPAGLPADFPPLNTLNVAFRRGMLRATLVFGSILAVIAGLALSAVTQAHRADRERRLAQEQEANARQQRYAAQVNLAQQAWEAGNVGRARELLIAQQPGAPPRSGGPGQEDLRGFEWRYLWRLCQADAPFTLHGHNDAVTSVAFSADGKTLASGSADQAVRLWDVASQRLMTTLRVDKKHTGNIWSVAFAPSGRILAAGSMDGNIRLWDLRSRRVVAAFAGHKGWARSVAFSPSGNLLASGGQNPAIKLWDLAARREVVTFTAHQPLVLSVAFSQDGRTLATGSQDKTVKLWDLTSLREAATLRGHVAGVSSVAFSRDGKILASGSGDGTVKLWDLAARQEITTLRGHTDAIHLAFSPDDKILATGSIDHTVKLWDLTTKQEVTTFRGHTGGVVAVAFSPDGKLLASGSEDQTVKLWNPNSKPDTTVIRSAGVASIQFSPDGKRLAMGHAEGTVKLWDLTTQQPAATLKGHTGSVGAVVFSPDGKLMATGSGVPDKTVALWDVGRGPRRALAPEEGEPRFGASGSERQRRGPCPGAVGEPRSGSPGRKLATFNGYSGWTNCLAFSPDGKLLAMAGSDRSVKLCDVGSRREAFSLERRTKTVFSVAFSPDGKTLASGSEDKTITLWDTVTWRKRATLKGHTGHVHFMAFSPDGTLLAGGGDRSTVPLWNVKTGRQITTLQAPGAVYGVVFSQEGKTLAGGSASTVTLWNLKTWQEVATIKGHLGSVVGVAFSPDGNTLASASDDGTVRLWRASGPALPGAR